MLRPVKVVFKGLSFRWLTSQACWQMCASRCDGRADMLITFAEMREKDRNRFWPQPARKLFSRGWHYALSSIQAIIASVGLEYPPCSKMLVAIVQQCRCTKIVLQKVKKLSMISSLALSNAVPMAT